MNRPFGLYQTRSYDLYPIVKRIFERNINVTNATNMDIGPPITFPTPVELARRVPQATLQAVDGALPILPKIPALNPQTTMTNTTIGSEKKESITLPLDYRPQISFDDVYLQYLDDYIVPKIECLEFDPEFQMLRRGNVTITSFFTPIYDSDSDEMTLFTPISDGYPD